MKPGGKRYEALLDPAAASRLDRLAYYREVYAAKPAWQGL